MADTNFISEKLLKKYSNTIVIVGPQQQGSSTAGTQEYNNYYISDATADSPSITLTHTTARPTAWEQNLLFSIGTTRTGTLGIAPTFALKYTATGWRIKIITCFVYRNSNSDSGIDYAVYDPNNIANNVSNVIELTFPATLINPSLRASILTSINNSNVIGDTTALLTSANLQVVVKDISV